MNNTNTAYLSTVLTIDYRSMTQSFCVCVQSADDFSERSLRMAEVSRDQRNLEEEEEEDGSPLEANKGEERHTCSKSVFFM